MTDDQSNRKLTVAVSMPELSRPVANGSPQKRVRKNDDGRDRQQLAALEKSKSSIEIGKHPAPSSEPFGRGATFEWYTKSRKHPSTAAPAYNYNRSKKKKGGESLSNNIKINKTFHARV